MVSRNFPEIQEMQLVSSNNYLTHSLTPPSILMLFSTNALVVLLQNPWYPLHLKPSTLTVQAAVVRYMQSLYLRFCISAIEKWPFFWNLCCNSMSFYMPICCMRAYFWGPYLSHITRSTCFCLWNRFFLKVSVKLKPDSSLKALPEKPWTALTCNEKIRDRGIRSKGFRSTSGRGSEGRINIWTLRLTKTDRRSELRRPIWNLDIKVEILMGVNLINRERSS